ncbi:MAG: malectin domain-containing carbohydrate-binding protein [Bryobacteraceae bacterium]
MSSLLLGAVCFGQATVPLRINCGGWEKDVTGADGKVWLVDRYYDGGFNRYKPASVTTDWEVWSTTREGVSDFNYKIPIANGTYNVTLRFIEEVVTTKGARVFNVLANGVVVLDHLDIVALAGPMTPLTKKISNVSVTGGLLTLSFRGVTAQPSVAGIEVESAGTVTTPPPATVTVGVTPASVTLQAGKTQQFTAAVSGSTNQSVTWSLSSSLANPGTVSSTGLYTAPASVTQAGAVTVKATSAASSTASATATVNLATAVSTSVSPKSTTILSAQTAQFTASVSGSSNTQVNWSCSSGSISSAGLLTAPTVSSPTQVTVTAKSAADPTVADTAQVTVNPATTAPPPTSGTGSYLEQNGQVTLEAENAQIANVGSVQWLVSSAQAGFSGTGYLNSSVNTGSTFTNNFVGSVSGGSFTVKFAKTGTYYVWVRGLGATYADDSIHVGLDGAAVSTATQISAFDVPNKAWSWAGNQMDAGRATINITSSGQHKINFWMREDGFLFDKLLLTTDANFVPQGLGPAGSPTDSSTPVLSVSPLSMNFSAAAGGSDPASQSAQVSNGGGGTLSFTASSGQSWLTVSPGSGSAPANLTIQPKTAGLAAGTYTGSVTVSSPGQTAKIIAVVFAVSAPLPATLSVTPSSLSFAALQGGSNPPAQNLAIANTGSGSISWNASADKPWLSVSPGSGSAPATLGVSVSLSGLAAGSYSGTVTVNAPGAAGAPKLIGVTLTIQGPSSGKQWYVAPNGSSAGDGSISKPWDIVTAFNAPSVVKPGDTVWLRGGTHGNGNYINAMLSGTAAQPVTIRQYPGERAILNGGMGVYGTYGIYWGFEIAQLNPWDRWNNAPPQGINSFAVGNKFINMIIHDTALGVALWRSAPDNEAYGNIIYHNGYQGSDRGHGHGIYTQNLEGKKVIHDNIIFNQFGFGLHAYGSDAAFVQNYDVQGNISFNNGSISVNANAGDNILFAVGSSMANIKVDNNYTYYPTDKNQGQDRLSWPGGGPHQDVAARGNYFIGGYAAIEVCNWQTIDFRNNVAFSKAGVAGWLCTDQGQSPGTYNWNNNTYYGVDNFRWGNTNMNFASWKSSTHMDANSVLTPGRPTGVWKFVRPNKYEAGRGHIVIYNWDLASTVAVDLSSVLAAGTAFEIRNVQDYFKGPIVSGTYNGGTVSIPMTGLTVAQPYGSNVPTAAVPTGPEFATFVVLPK